MILVRKDKLIAGLWTCMSAKCCSLSRGLALVALSIAFLNQAHAQQDSNTTEPQAVLPQATQLENSPFIHMDVALEMEGIEKSVEGIQDSFASISQSLRVIADSDHLSLEQQQALTNAKSKTPSNPKGRKPLPAALEREIHEHKLDTPQCDCCKAPLHECGKEISEELKVIPQKVSVIRHERTKYACRQCEKTQTTTKVITAPKPASLLPKSIASADAMAAVVTAKYVDALPLYSQVDILKRSGIEIWRATLSNWCVQLGDKVQRVIDAMQVQLKQESLICADETTVQVLREEDKKAQSKSYMWVYRSGEFTTNPIVIYDYQPGRAAIYPESFLSEYQGYLLSDSYSAYNKLQGITQAGCWAHARRYFIDAQKKRPTKKVGKVEVA